MGLISRFKGPSANDNSTAGSNNVNATNGEATRPRGVGSMVDALENNPDVLDDSPLHLFTPRLFAMGIIVSIGGMIFGYDTGQISGFIAMKDFLKHFGDETSPSGEKSFSNSREGTIVGLLSIGTLIGALSAGPIADRIGRRLSIVWWNIMFCVGVIVQITSTTAWYQIAIGRLIAGFGVGGLSVLTPMYQSETAPKQLRGAMVSAYQLFVTLGIFTADCINFGTKSQNSSASWKLPMGIGFIWPAIMAVGIMFLRESPRWDYRMGNIDRARKTIALSYGVPETHRVVAHELREIKEKFDAENTTDPDGVPVKHPWYEIFTGPRMAYRTLLGITMQMLQQLTGANFFFYYGTSVFQSVGLSDSFVTAMILGGVNFGLTFPGLWLVENYGRRRCLIAGGLWMFMCFMVFASVGHFILQPDPGNTTAGYVMIVFACLFIAAFAMTWGPIVWALVGELYPSRYRAKAMGLATASNWIWNFLISFFTSFITASIDYRYGYVFAACCFAGAVIVYFFVCETKGRSLEEIDTMYIMHVKPWKSSGWTPPQGEDLVDADKLFLDGGARNIRKRAPTGERRDTEMLEGNNDLSSSAESDAEKPRESEEKQEL